MNRSTWWLPALLAALLACKSGGGRLETVGDVRILKLSGTPYEMGRQHGELMGHDIMALVNGWVASLSRGSSVDVALLYQLVGETMVYDEPYREELRGLLDGIRGVTSPEERTVRIQPGKEHELDLADLEVLNALGDWASAFGCSALSAWKPRQGGSLRVARNFDYVLGSGDSVYRGLVVFSYAPSSGPRWVNVGMAGAIGCITCMNEHGVYAHIQDTNGLPGTAARELVPRLLILRRLMETTSASSTLAEIHASLDATQVYTGNNFQVCLPDANGARANDDRAGVFEYDGKADHADGRATLRVASDNAGLASGHALALDHGLYVTNHYLKRRAPLTSGDSFSRAMRLRDGLPDALSDGELTVEDGRALMQSVGGTATLHTTVFEPDTRKVSVWLAKPGVGAFSTTRHDFTFDELF